MFWKTKGASKVETVVTGFSITVPGLHRAGNVVHATGELLIIGKGESGCCAMQGREALVYFEIAMRWNELKRTDGVRSFVVQEEVVCVADELFRKERARYYSLAGGARGLGVVVVC